MLPLRYMGPVVKMGDGDLGGKARVLPFVQRLLDASGARTQLAPHAISVPETWVLATDCFSDFVARNHLDGCADIADDSEVRRRFLAADFSDELKDTLFQYLERHTQPLAVRSSALNEDTYHSATAGLFTTVFIPNRGPHRFCQLAEAIKLVFASAFYADVNRFLQAHSIPREEGQMAVALESVVGTSRGSVHFPLVGGVAQSVNFFPVGEMRPEDGVVTIVMGLGSRAVSGRDGMRFCPAYPLVRPSLQQDADIRSTTQTLIDAVNLDAAGVHLRGDEHETIREVPLAEVEAGTQDELGMTGLDILGEVASVYDAESGIFYDSLFRPGERVLTFNRLLRESSFPLPSTLRRIMRLLEEGFGAPVEIEFALDVLGSGKAKRYQLVLLQARPLPSLTSETQVDLPELPLDRVLLRTDRALGHGATDHLRHIVFVDPEVFSLETSAAIAAEVATLNEQMVGESKQYLLLGPGRWGSCNRAVGVPVTFRQIDQARLVAELATGRLAAEPSQGTHFFHNMVDQQLFFLTVDVRRGHHLALDWLRKQPNTAQTRLAKLIESPRALCIRVDAHRRGGMVYFGS
jgi:hypothetical protein